MTLGSKYAGVLISDIAGTEICLRTEKTYPEKQESYSSASKTFAGKDSRSSKGKKKCSFVWHKMLKLHTLKPLKDLLTHLFFDIPYTMTETFNGLFILSTIILHHILNSVGWLPPRAFVET